MYGRRVWLPGQGRARGAANDLPLAEDNGSAYRPQLINLANLKPSPLHKSSQSSKVHRAMSEKMLTLFGSYRY